MSLFLRTCLTPTDVDVVILLDGTRPVQVVPTKTGESCTRHYFYLLYLIESDSRVDTLFSNRPHDDL